MAPRTSAVVYDKEYFTAAQCSVYIGDILIDEITSLQVSVLQKKMPIYGYASQLFDKVAKGTVLVEGNFTINFKESGYLNTVLERYKSLNGDSSLPSLSPYVSGNAFSQQLKNRTGGAKQNGTKGFLSRLNIEQAQQNQRIADAVVEGKINGRPITPEELIDFYQDLSGFNNDSPARSGSVSGALPGIEDTFESFEDRVWSTSNDDAEWNDRRADSNRFDDFTIYVAWGDYNTNDRVNHTSKRIDNVRIIGQHQQMDLSGEPVQEAYSFIARNFS